MSILKEKRKEKKYSVRKLGSLVGVSRQTILDWESGKYPPTEARWTTLKHILGLDNFYDYFDRKPRPKGRKKLYTEDSICAEEGCTKRPICRGYCKTHYSRYRAHK